MSGARFRIRRMEIEGFKAFAARQSLEVGGHLFVFGRNGRGKSSVVEAVRWCLFGLAGREAEVRNVFYAAAECKVELELEGPGGRWKIQRRLRPGSGRSDQTIQDPSGATVPQSEVFPHIARLGPREGTHIIFASQQSSHRRPQADITDFDRVLYSYMQIDDVPDVLRRLDQEIEDQGEIERQLAEKVNEAEETLREELGTLRNRMEEILAATPWPGGSVPTNAETDARIRAFVQECGGSPERQDGGTVTREWLLKEAERAIQDLSATTEDSVRAKLVQAKATIEKVTSAKRTFEASAEESKAAKDGVESRDEELRTVLGGKTKLELLKERDELERQEGQVSQSLALMEQAVRYLTAFSPEECPVCDGRVSPSDVVVGLERRIGSEREAARVADALEDLRARVNAVEEAESALEAARIASASADASTSDALDEFTSLLDDPTDLSSSERMVERLSDSVRHLELELTESGSLVVSKRTALKGLQAEARFQGYRRREERLQKRLESGLQPAREAHGEFTEVLDTLREIRAALQQSFNDILDGTLPKIGDLMTGVYGRLTQQSSFPKIVVESGPTEATRDLRLRVTSDRTPGESFEPSEVLNGQAYNALNLVPYFVFSQFRAEALELDCLLIDDPSQSFDTSRVELLMQELAAAATHAQLIVASHEKDRFEPFVERYFSGGTYRMLEVTSFDPESGPTLEYSD